MQIVAKTFFGLEALLAEEIRAIGGENIVPLKRAVAYEGDQKVLYRSNYELRTALRILKPFHSFKTKHENHLYKKLCELDWPSYFSLDQTFAINAVTTSKYMDHSHYLALKTKDAIVDTFRLSHKGQRPSIDLDNPDVRLNVHLGYDNVCTLSWDSSGESLHKRGYRVQALEAPINEVLAAGMVLLAKWDKERPLVDPMCGSGTILIEAASYACQLPPQRLRQQFGFMKWKDYDKTLWKSVRQAADAQAIDTCPPILGYDKDFKAVKACSMNILAASLEDHIEINRIAIEKLDEVPPDGVIICNPPYDERLAMEDIYQFYNDVGHILKHRFVGYDAWLISSNVRALKQLGLKPSSKQVLFNGALECLYNCYELYKGSRKIEESTAES